MDDVGAYGLRLCFSGVESRKLLDTFTEFDVRHIQVSYFYIQRVFSDPLEFEKFSLPFHTVIIDSGLVYGRHESEEDKKAFLEDYASYISALDQRTYHGCVISPDIEDLVDIPHHKRIYNLEDIEPIFEGNIKSVFENMEYIGVGYKVAKDEDRISQICSYAARAKHSKLHAFGTSSAKILKKYPFYSANSSSWRTGSRYANTYIYEGPTRGLRIYQPSDKSDLVKTEREKKQYRTRQRSLIKARYNSLFDNIDWTELIEEDNSWEVDKANLVMWKMYQDDLELDWKNKYHLGGKDIDALKIRKQEITRHKRDGDMKEKKGKKDSSKAAHKSMKNKKNSSDSIEEESIEDPQEISGDIVEEDSENSHDKGGQDIQVRSNPAYTSGFQSSNISVPRVREDGVESIDVSSNRLTPLDPRQYTLRKCDDCILAGRCPKYEPGSDCAYGLSDTYDPLNIEGHIMEDTADLLAIQKDRIMQLYLEEKTDAAGASKDLTTNIKLYLEMIEMLSNATDKRDTLSIHAKGTGLLELFKK